jgi:hypothetical protein
MTRNEIVAAIAGVACLTFSAVMLYRTPVSACSPLELKLYFGAGALGLLLIVPSQIAAGLRAIGAAAVEQWKAYKSAEKADAPPPPPEVKP